MRHTVFGGARISLCLSALVVLPVSAVMEPATPESQGISSEAILKFVDACEQSYEGDTAEAIHGFVIVRHGKTIAEGSWKPFDTLNETHMLYSHSKSFTSSAIGFLADEGKIDLDERVVDLFPEDLPEKVSDNLKQLRVRDLLTMTAGAPQDHRIGGFSKDWTKAFLEKDFANAPGTVFKYDSDATYMLAAIVEKKSGEKMMDFLKRKMFDKIGISSVWTTFSPEGIPCGGWGMNMTTREMARFGQLYLDRGAWAGEPVLSPFWVDLASARHTANGWQSLNVKALGEGGEWIRGYCFQFWRGQHGSYRADGAAGQETVVLRKEDMVVSLNAGVADMQKEIDLIWKFLLPAAKDAPLAENPAALAALRAKLAKLELKPVAWNCSRPIGWQKTFALKDNPRGFKSVSFAAAKGVKTAGSRPLVRCTLMTRAGEQTFLAGDGCWTKGDKIRIDTESYEAPGGYIGEHVVAASCGVEDGPTFHLRAYLTGTTGYLDFRVGSDGNLTGEFWAMNGCKLESATSRSSDSTRAGTNWARRDPPTRAGSR